VALGRGWTNDDAPFPYIPPITSSSSNLADLPAVPPIATLKHAVRRVLYKRIVEEGGDIDGPCQTWTDADEEELEALKNDPIEMRDTAYARFEAEKKKDLVWAYRKMNLEERAQLLQDCDEMGINANDLAPPSPTPV
jgi:hypothetical protein